MCIYINDGEFSIEMFKGKTNQSLYLGYSYPWVQDSKWKSNNQFGELSFHESFEQLSTLASQGASWERTG